MPQERIAITGATGFVGTHLVRALRAAAIPVRALVRASSKTEHLESLDVDCRRVSLDDAASLEAALLGCDVVFHLAGAVDFQGDGRRLHHVNVEGTRNILRAAANAGVRRAVATSSIVAVAGNREPRICDESERWNLASVRVPYVTTKRRAEEVALGERFGGLEVVVVNPSCVIGPDDMGSEFGVICQRFWRGRIPFFFGGGTNFVDVRDVAAGHLAAAQFGRPGERYLLTGTNLTWNDFFVALSRTARQTIPRLRLPAVFGEWFAAGEALWRGESNKRPNLSPDQAKLMPLYFFFHHEKATRELGYRPRSLKDTLADTFASWRVRRGVRTLVG